jgi:hypothetical protein
MALKAMSTASKVSVRIDGEGVLSMHFMVDVEGRNCFVEFRVWFRKLCILCVCARVWIHVSL